MREKKEVVGYFGQKKNSTTACKNAAALIPSLLG